MCALIHLPVLHCEAVVGVLALEVTVIVVVFAGDPPGIALTRKGTRVRAERAAVSFMASYEYEFEFEND